MSTKNRERGYAMVLGILLVLTLVSLSTAVVYSAASQHLASMQDTDRARSLALAEGGVTLVLTELSDDPVGPVKNEVSFALQGTTYVRTFQPFDAGDGSVRVEVSYFVANGGAFDPLIFADRADPTESYKRVRVVVTGIRPRSQRSIELELETQFVLFQSAVVSDAIPTAPGGTGKSRARRGHIVFDDLGRAGQFFVNGDLTSNGDVVFEDSGGISLTTGNANDYLTFAGSITSGLAGTEEEVPDYTALGSQDQLFDFNRFIAAARVGAGREFTSLATFVAAMNIANAAGQPLEGITVLYIDPAFEMVGLERPRIVDGAPDGPWEHPLPGGINIRGTLLFNFAPGTDPMYKVYLSTDVNINPADLSGLVPADPSTYTSGYSLPWNDDTKKPSAVDISGAGFSNFTANDDLPAIMFNTGVVDQHGASNICGLVYGPSFVEIENKDGQLQYFNGAVMGGGGVYIEGNAVAGNTVINFDPTTIDLLATQGGKGQGLRILSWRTLP